VKMIIVFSIKKTKKAVFYTTLF